MRAVDKRMLTRGTGCHGTVPHGINPTPCHPGYERHRHNLNLVELLN